MSVIIGIMNWDRYPHFLFGLAAFLFVFIAAGSIVFSSYGTSTHQMAQVSDATSSNFLSCTPNTAALTPSGGITISGSDKVITGLKISNPTGRCINVASGSTNITIKDSEIGPCGGSSGQGIYIGTGSSNINIENVYIHDTSDIGVMSVESSNVTLTNSYIENVRSGFYAFQGSGMNVSNNRFKNMKGPFPQAQFVQFHKVNGGVNKINYNVGINEPGVSNPEDAINTCASRGTAENPIEIKFNKIKGGGPSGSGGGIILGDCSSSYAIAEGNILVDPGQYGISITGGDHNTLKDNLVYGREQSFTNIGMVVWSWTGGNLSCTNASAINNRVYWINNKGAANHCWDGSGSWGGASTCGSITGVNTNQCGDASLNEDIFNIDPNWGDIKICAGGTTTTTPPPTPTTPVASLCTTYSNTTTPPQGYGAPYNLFTTAKELLLSALCNTDNTVTLTSGNSQATTYIWNQAYYTRNSSTWNPITLTGPNTAGNGQWIIGSANTTVPLTTTEQQTQNYFASYVCTYTNNSWKCGCSDTACAIPKWNLQGVKR